MCIGWYKIKTFKKWLQKRERINNKQYIFAIIINYILQNSLFSNFKTKPIYNLGSFFVEIQIHKHN